jgi:hypothetical protein
MTPELFFCAKPQGARPTGEPDVFATEQQRYLRVRTKGEERWYRMEKKA